MRTASREADPSGKSLEENEKTFISNASMESSYYGNGASESNDNNDDDDDDYLDTEDDVVDSLPELPTHYYGQKGRHSVSAEAYGDWNKKQAFIPPVHEKTPEQRKRIESVLVTSFLFQHLDSEDLQKILLAFTEIRVSEGETFIRQGDDGDCLYLIEKGTVDVFKHTPDNPEPTKMCVMTSGDAVGELALMYNCPRAATVVAQTDVVLWALDRGTFNHIVKEAAAKRRDLYESFLKEVEILKSTDPYERSKLSDALKSITFAPNQVIIKQGDIGDTFYIIESGKAVALKDGEVVMNYGRGDYFGELALLKDQPRAATVKALEEPVRCVSLNRHSFKRLLGPLEEFLKRNAERYNLLFPLPHHIKKIASI